MITELDQKTKERINHAIANIRFIATRAKRALILDATQRAEITVNLLNEFRQHVNAIIANDTNTIRVMPFRYDLETLQRVVHATFQADSVYAMLSRTNQKKYDEQHQQVWNLLENIHAYVLRVIEKGSNYAAQ